MASRRFTEVLRSADIRRGKVKKGISLACREATLPAAESMENVSFAEISINPGEPAAKAVRRRGLSAAMRKKIRKGDLLDALLQLLEARRERSAVRLSEALALLKGHARPFSGRVIWKG